jgi:integrase/recombinase XerD
MLTLFRRHTLKCRHTSRDERRCSCPIAVEGTLNGEYVRKSLGLRSWEAAQKLVREWEVQGKEEKISVAEACDKFYADAEARNLGQAQLGKYRLLLNELKGEYGNKMLSSISVDDLRECRAAWRLSPVSAYKKLERLRTFFRFCHDSGWIARNPAKVLKPPKVKTKPTLPFSDGEMEKILWACEVYPNRPKGRQKEVKAFVLLLRYSGLRIRDAVTLRRAEITGRNLHLYTAKTGSAVYVPLPDVAVEALGEVQNVSAEYFFWSGNGNPKSAVADWQRSLKRLFGLAGIKGHAHRFRDTFAVSLLQNGVSLENVSVLLGHNSIRVTEKHYAPWVKSRQENLEREVKKAWE